MQSASEQGIDEAANRLNWWKSTL